jgi:hypothetical protein
MNNSKRFRISDFKLTLITTLLMIGLIFIPENSFVPSFVFDIVYIAFFSLPFAYYMDRRIRAQKLSLPKPDIGNYIVGSLAFYFISIYELVTHIF